MVNNFGGLDREASRKAPKQAKGTIIMLTPLTATIDGNLHVGLAAFAAAIGVAIIGAKACEAVGRNPGAANKILLQSILAIAFAEGIVFFAIFLATRPWPAQ